MFGYGPVNFKLSSKSAKIVKSYDKLKFAYLKVSTHAKLLVVLKDYTHFNHIPVVSFLLSFVHNFPHRNNSRLPAWKIEGIQFVAQNHAKGEKIFAPGCMDIKRKSIILHKSCTCLWYCSGVAEATQIVKNTCRNTCRPRIAIISKSSQNLWWCSKMLLSADEETALPESYEPAIVLRKHWGNNLNM